MRPMLADFRFEGTTQPGPAGGTSAVPDRSNLGGDWRGALLGRWSDERGGSWRVVDGVLVGTPGPGRPSVLARPAIEPFGRAGANIGRWIGEGAILAWTPAAGWPDGDALAWAVAFGYSGPDAPYYVAELRSAACPTRPGTLGIRRVEGASSAPLGRFHGFGGGPAAVAWAGDPSRQYQLAVDFGLRWDYRGPTPAAQAYAWATAFDLADGSSAGVAAIDPTPSVATAGGTVVSRPGLAAPEGSGRAEFGRVALSMGHLFRRRDGEKLAGDPPQWVPEHRWGVLPAP